MATATQPTVVQTSIHYLPVDSLRDDELLKSLYKPIEGKQWSNFKSSINRNGGCRVPVLVVRVGKNHYIWDGYQRVRAHRELGIDRIPCFLLPGGNQTWSDEQKVLWAADMNEHRRHDLTIIGRALLYLASVGKPGPKKDDPESKNNHETLAKPPQETINEEKDVNSEASESAATDDGKHTADEAAKDTGFANKRQAQKAAKVAKLGCLEVRDGLSAEHISLDEGVQLVTDFGPPAQAAELEKLLRKKNDAKAAKKQPANGKPRESADAPSLVWPNLLKLADKGSAMLLRSGIVTTATAANETLIEDVLRHGKKELTSEEWIRFVSSIGVLAGAIKKIHAAAK